MRASMRGSCGTVLAADGQVTDRAWDGELSPVAFAPKAIARPHVAIETDANMDVDLLRWREAVRAARIEQMAGTGVGRVVADVLDE